MKLVFSGIAFAVAANAAVAGPHPFGIHDLVMLDRVSDPQISPDGKRAAYQVRETDYEKNKGKNGIWLIDLGNPKAQAARLTDTTVNATAPRWSADGAAVYYQDKGQVWRLPAGGKGAAVQVTNLAVDVNAYKLSPDGKHVLLSIDMYPDCGKESDAIACTKQRLDDKEKAKATGRVYDKLFVRHWDTWADGRRSQWFVAAIGADGKIDMPHLVTQGIDGDVPSKPFGGDDEFEFSPDGKTVYFSVRIAGNSEPWSTNFDIYSVPADASAAPKNLTGANKAWDTSPVPSADGRTLYYLAMKRPTFEADRFGIMAMDLASGATREIDPQWDRSAGSLKLSDDGKTLYATADDNGEHPLFAIDVATGNAAKLAGEGSIHEYSVRGNDIVFSRTTLKTPADLFRIGAKGGKAVELTNQNSTRMAFVETGAFEPFTFKGANGDSVQGYMVKPVGFDKSKKYPVAFLIHGGPQGAFGNDWSYRWNPQTYAGQGFAVVMVNFHGSTGYGQAFTDSISGDWGGKPLEDLQKGWVAALEKYTFLDGDRACALGASYGGYMIYWIAGKWNQPWKCLVDHDGVFDNRMMGYSTEELWFSEWENKGTPWEKPDNYEKFNPVNYVKDWRAPMLVVHSEQDFRIPVEQGIAAFTALQRRGIPSELLTFPDENHWVLKPQNSVLWHDTVNAWLKRWTAQ
ncbi:MAG: S9 family peptidase [Rudaea sp.]|uniref:S9 family peptidase n=1 Tax=Rudaea sp. TaxID=2136325 RepID=UPI0039E54BDE